MNMISGHKISAPWNANNFLSVVYRQQFQRSANVKSVKPKAGFDFDLSFPPESGP